MGNHKTMWQGHVSSVDIVLGLRRIKVTILVSNCGTTDKYCCDCAILRVYGGQDTVLVASGKSVDIGMRTTVKWADAVIRTHRVKYLVWPWLVYLSGLSTGLRTKGLLVRFPVRAHAWVADQVPGGGGVRSNHTLMFLSLSFSFPSPLKINKIF